MKKNKIKIIRLLLIVAIIGIVVSITGLVYTYMQYHNSREKYEQIEEYVSVNDAPTFEALEAKKENIQEEPVQEEKAIKVNLDVDTTSLKNINPDYLGRILYEPLQISYPIVLDRGDDYYENHSFDMESDRAGGIFMDYACKSNFDSFNTIIYGHNMKDGSMFGGLKKLVNSPEMIAEEPYFYIFTEDYAYMYKIVCTYYAGAKTKTYDLLLDYTMEDKEAYVDYIESVATYKDEEFFAKDITDELRIVTLSTCHGLHSTQRTVIHGELVAKEQR